MIRNIYFKFSLLQVGIVLVCKSVMSNVLIGLVYTRQGYIAVHMCAGGWRE